MKIEDIPLGTHVKGVDAPQTMHFSFSFTEGSRVLDLRNREGILIRHGREVGGIHGFVGGDPPPSLWKDCQVVQFFHDRDEWEIQPYDLLYRCGRRWLTYREVIALPAWPDELARMVKDAVNASRQT
jgi:hypothetical protein